MSESERFDNSVNDATYAVINEFEWMELPESHQLSALMIEINDAITKIMEGWRT